MTYHGGSCDVAVIGAGPCGLACAAELKKAGYEVCVFDMEAEAGGNIRYGLPAYAGQADALAREIEELKARLKELGGDAQ